MFRSVAQRTARNVFRTTKPTLGGSALNGNATSPHYADFGYGANQMLPTHEILKNPYPYKWQPKKATPIMVSGHRPDLDQHQIFTQGTGYHASLVAGVDHYGELVAKDAVFDRIRGGLGYATILGTLVGYEIFMWDGLQFPQQPLWDELQEINLRVAAHSLQWERSWKEMKSQDVPLSEVYQIIDNRPFKQNNPYYFSHKDLEIADKNVSYRVLEPALAAVDDETYRKETLCIMFYTELARRISEVSDAKNLETELSEWLYTQTKYSMADLKDILQVAPDYADEFSFHKNAIFDAKANQIVFFDGVHRATVEELAKEQQSVEPLSANGGSALQVAQPLLAQLIKNGPVDYLQIASNNTVAQTVLQFIAMEPANEGQVNKLNKLAEQVLSSTDNSLATFQATAKGLNLPVPVAFTASAINAAVAKAAV